MDLAASPDASKSVVIESGSCSVSSLAAADKVEAALSAHGLKSVDAIVCTGGAWAGGSLATAEGLASVDRCVAATAAGIFKWTAHT